MAGPLGWLDPHVDQYVLTKAGEQKVLEVHKHWIVLVWPVTRLVAAGVIFVTAWAFQGPVYWIFLILAAGLGGQALWRITEEYRDRFVITNQRVFRVNGNFTTARASVPLGRILDITVRKPLLGHVFDFGHFVFESAAQVQGLNEIRYVGDIDAREDELRLAMQGKTPQVAIPPEEDDGT
jgi:membrane protein YdbS with pleckstrin-like domain